ncbi:MAG: energy-coupling factor transporter transmembrane component T [Propioniciclava sp.]
MNTVTRYPLRTSTRQASAHPWAWWGWAVGMAGSVSLTTNPLLLALVALAVAAVVVFRRGDAPWARSIGAYVAVAGVIIGIRMVFQIILGAGTGSTVWFTLPELTLPDWAAGVRLGGPVTAESLVYAFNDALRLGVLLFCLGAANALANPRQALRNVPAALYEFSVAVVIALSVAPQLIESTQRIRRARQLRGGAVTSRRAVRAVIIPVLADAVDRSLLLAAGMEARGFGRTREGRRPSGTATALVLGSMMAVVLGTYGLLSSATSLTWALPALTLGLVGSIAGLRAAGRGLRVTRYRPQPWRRADTGVIVAGLIAFGTAVLANVGGMTAAGLAWHPPTDPLTWPTLHPWMLAVLGGGLAPVALIPTPPRTAREPEPA